jgi:hypothetical protein
VIRRLVRRYAGRFAQRLVRALARDAKVADNPVLQNQDDALRTRAAGLPNQKSQRAFFEQRGAFLFIDGRKYLEFGLFLLGERADRSEIASEILQNNFTREFRPAPRRGAAEKKK